MDRNTSIMYIVSYVTKDEREMGEVLCAAKKEHGDKDIQLQVRKIGSVFLTHQQWHNDGVAAASSEGAPLV